MTVTLQPCAGSNSAVLDGGWHASAHHSNPWLVEETGSVLRKGFLFAVVCSSLCQPKIPRHGVRAERERPVGQKGVPHRWERVLSD
eukprot:scaffold300343_cov28-Tisochrysis_lutea.AAC.2